MSQIEKRTNQATATNMAKPQQQQELKALSSSQENTLKLQLESLQVAIESTRTQQTELSLVLLAQEAELNRIQRAIAEDEERQAIERREKELGEKWAQLRQLATGVNTASELLRNAIREFQRLAVEIGDKNIIVGELPANRDYPLVLHKPGIAKVHLIRARAIESELPYFKSVYGAETIEALTSNNPNK